jgi:hypothetical protein
MLGRMEASTSLITRSPVPVSLSEVDVMVWKWC